MNTFFLNRVATATATATALLEEATTLRCSRGMELSNQALDLVDTASRFTAAANNEKKHRAARLDAILKRPAETRLVEARRLLKEAEEILASCRKTDKAQAQAQAQAQARSVEIDRIRNQIRIIQAEADRNRRFPNVVKICREQISALEAELENLQRPATSTQAA